MDIETFLQLKPTWAYEPCLYIVKQMFPGNNAYRCGAAGTQLFKAADPVYGSDRSGSFTGLLGRMTMYKNYWLPLKGTLYAALRIKKQLIARPGQRVGVDSFGAQYNIDRGNQTLVLQREAEMHSEMDKRGLRWQKDKKNELFAPRKSVKELIDAMRTIRGEDMYLFDSETIREDTTYDGGRDRLELVMTQKRELPPRAAATEISAPTITLKLSKKAIEELQLLDPVKLAKLVDIIDAVTGRGAPQKPQAPAQNPPPPVPIPQPPPAPPPPVPRTREAIRQRIAAQFGQPAQVLPTGRTREAVRQRIAARFPNMQQRFQGLQNYVMVQ
jgi:hypothetical protein